MLKKSICVLLILFINCTLFYFPVYGSTSPRIKNVTVELQPGVKALPKGMHYELTKSADSSKGNLSNSGVTNTAKGKANTIKGSDGKLYNVDQDVEITPDTKSKFTLKNRKQFASFNPLKDQIYIDSINHTCFKIVDDPVSSPDGSLTFNTSIPQYNEVVKKLQIPQQNVPLVKSDLVNVDSRFKVSDVASPKNRDFLPGDVSTENGSVKFTLTKDIKIYPLDKDPAPPPDTSKMTDEEKEKDRKTKEAKQLMKDENSVNDTKPDSSGSEIYLQKDSSITVSMPSMSLFADIGYLTSDVGVKLSSNVTIDGKLKGSVHFSKEIQIPLAVYGLDIACSIPGICDSVGGVYIGVFLVFDVNGNITLKSEFIENGIFDYGIAAHFTNLGNFLGVDPYFDYHHEKLDISSELDGTLSAQMSLVPQAGVEIFGIRIIVLQCWAGIRSTATLAIKDSTSEKGSVSADFKVESVVQALFYLAGKKFTLYDNEDTIYDKSWSYKEGDPPINIDMDNGGNPYQLIPININVYTACAARDKVFGNITLKGGNTFKSIKQVTNKLTKAVDPIVELNSTKPYTLGGVSLKVYRHDKPNAEPETYPITTDSKGNFIFPIDLTWGDKIQVTVDHSETPEGATIPQVYKAETPMISAYIPYKNISIDADVFNNIVSGSISGDSFGFDRIRDTGDEAVYNGPVEIVVTDGGGKVKNYTTSAVNGTYACKNVTMDADSTVCTRINFEGQYIKSQSTVPNLDALRMGVYKTWVTDKKGGTKKLRIEGYIENLKGDHKPYLGIVKLVNWAMNGPAPQEKKAVLYIGSSSSIRTTTGNNLIVKESLPVSGFSFISDHAPTEGDHKHNFETGASLPIYVSIEVNGLYDDIILYDGTYADPKVTQKPANPSLPGGSGPVVNPGN